MECGVKTGFYRKGASVGTCGAVCLECGKLFRVRNGWRGRYVYSRFCRICAPTWLVEEEKLRTHRQEALLEPYLEYLEGMKRGKEYRLRKGERLRQQRGIERGTNGSSSATGSPFCIDGGTMVPVISTSKIDGKFHQMKGEYWCCLVRADQVSLLH